MRTPGGGASCRDAETYYFDLLENDAAVPETIRHHVGNCLFCRRQIGRLKRLVSDSENEGGLSRPAIDGTVEALGRHFEWLDEPVACSHVKPFLPELLAPSSEIRIPTPITVHLDHCPSCEADLAALRRQDLTGNQLKRLSQLYRHPCGDHPADCRRARSAVASLATFSFENTDPEALNHVSTCVQCRAQVYRRRESLARDASCEKAFPCDDISPADIFDWVVPCGAETLGAEAGDERRRAVAAHVRSCPRCMRKLQSLHRTVYGIAERADSPICTIYHAKEDAQGAPGRYPIDVQVLHREPEPAIEPAGTSAAGVMAAARVMYSRHKPFVKVAFTGIAAVIVVALLFATGPTASGTSIRDLLGPLERAANIRITTWTHGAEDPIQEIWVARGLNLLMTGTRRRYTLYEFDDHRKRMTEQGVETGVPIKLSEREYEDARKFMIDCVSAVPGNVPAGATVYPTAPASPEAEGQSAVYEVTWAMPAHEGSTARCRLTVQIHPQTELPQTIEFSQKLLAGDEWEIRTTRTFEYLSEPAMEDAIRAFFPAE